jgi:undecaprenyl-diphosphatase
MRNSLPIELPPTRADVLTAEVIKRHASPLAEHVEKLLTFAADEKPLIAAAVLYWAYCHVRPPTEEKRYRANHLLICTAVSAALPHLLKRFVDRKRPDRKVVHGRRHGIPCSGNPLDSWPSGHAMHLGALAAALTRTAPTRVAVAGWISALALGSTRLLLLAHYLSDVVSGLILGSVLESGIARFDRRRLAKRRE